MNAGTQDIFKTLAFIIVFPGGAIFFIPLILQYIWDLEIIFGGMLGLQLFFGILFYIIGGTFLVTGILSFLIRGKGTPMIFFAKKVSFIFGKEPEKLMASGIYRNSRNPMYLGVIVATIGTAFMVNKVIILIWAAILFICFDLVVRKFEEPHLKRKHGEKYELYMKFTPRWLGRNKKPDWDAEHLKWKTVINPGPLKPEIIDIARNLGMISNNETKILKKLDSKKEIQEMGIDKLQCPVIRGLVKKRIIKVEDTEDEDTSVNSSRDKLDKG